MAVIKTTINLKADFQHLILYIYDKTLIAQLSVSSMLSPCMSDRGWHFTTERCRKSNDTLNCMFQLHVSVE